MWPGSSDAEGRTEGDPQISTLQSAPDSMTNINPNSDTVWQETRGKCPISQRGETGTCVTRQDFFLSSSSLGAQLLTQPGAHLGQRRT